MTDFSGGKAWMVLTLSGSGEYPVQYIHIKKVTEVVFTTFTSGLRTKLQS